MDRDSARASRSPGREEPRGSELPPPTERVNPASAGIDEKDSLGILKVIHEQDIQAWEAVRSALEPLARLVDDVVRAFRGGGRLFYFGAGTSGRLGVLDASECPPTYGVDPRLVQGFIAGGDAALRRSIEGAEDSADAGARAAAEAGIGPGDVVCGIAASGTTPYVWGAIEEAARRSASTALIHANPLLSEDRSTQRVDHLITLPVGPEVVSGSTRMKAGTATKMVLNMLTSAAMIRWGKVYDNLMVDVAPANRKLMRRACALIGRLAGVGPNRAAELLERSGGRVKVAVLMHLASVSDAEACRMLDANEGRLRDALLEAGVEPP